MPRHTLPSARTRARRDAAQQSHTAARSALRDGNGLRVSSATDILAGTVHHATARTLVRRGQAAHPALDGHPDMLDLTRIIPTDHS